MHFKSSNAEGATFDRSTRALGSSFIRSVLYLVFAALLFGVYVIESSVSWRNQFIFKQEELQNDTTQKPVKQTTSFVETESCRLEPLDPWHSMLSEQIEHDSRPKVPCKPKSKVRTELKNNTLTLIEPLADGEKCYFRCILKDEKTRMIRAEWSDLRIDVENNPQCDIVEVQCTKSNHTSYRFLHTQIYEKKSVEQSNPMPDVHIIVLDSVSMSHARRALPRTLEFFESELKGQIFNYLNKVGLNTMPNYYALLQGLAVGNERLVPFKSERALDSEAKQFCDLSARPSRFIMAKWKRQNYVTMYNEDWTSKFFKPDRCPEGAKAPVDHFFGNYFLRKYQLWPELREKYNIKHKEHHHENSWPKYCLKKSQEMLQQLEQFVRSYPNKPKASLSWLTYLAHDDKAELYQADEDFCEFFLSNQQHLEKSFVFLMGDHGSRLYNSSSVPIDRREDRNPLLAISAPKTLRSNSMFMEQLTRNKNQLVTHYDVYATLMDIAENFKSSWSPNSTSSYHSATKRGYSLFRPLPQPRNCQKLSIPFEYCNCVSRTKEIDDQKELALKLAKMAVKQINNEISQSSVLRRLCVLLDVDETKNPPVAEQLVTEETNQTVYLFTFHTTPSDALYQGYATHLPNSELSSLSERYPRLNPYANQANCLYGNSFDLFALNYCYCRNLLSKQ
ncbi:hypothetical protein M3Y98_00089700 [Aphelenchoides besseyi]|nr:hypothetical protein M3Y98_00089700 [Aphelenchoides besseyi]